MLLKIKNIKKQISNIDKKLGVSFLLIFGYLNCYGLQAVVKHNLFYSYNEIQKTFIPELEIQFEVDPQTILFEKKDNSWNAKIKVDISIFIDDETYKEDHYILKTPPVNEGIKTLTQKIMDLRKINLKKGKINYQITITDQIKSENSLSFSYDVEPTEMKSGLFFSSIQLIDTLFPVQSKDSLFFKNGINQIPFVVDFLENKKTLHYFAACYQTQEALKENQNYFIKTFISKKPLESTIYNLSKTSILQHQTTNYIQGDFPIAMLKSGNYYLNMIVEDSFKQTLLTNSLFFQVLNKKPEAFSKPTEEKVIEQKTDSISYVNLSKTFIVKYTPAQIRAILKMLLPISEPSERNRISEFLRSSDEMYSRYFIYNFWATREPNNPEQAWNLYAEKVKVVNKSFGSSSKPGYETDRGIIQLKYGAPTERIIVNNEDGAYPYEIWQYNNLPKNPNALFLFYKPGIAVTQYDLLHTTVLGEVRNKQWRNNLYLNGTNADPLNSKAEFYIGTR